MKLINIFLLAGILVGAIFGVIGVVNWVDFAKDTRVTGYTYEGKALLSQEDYDYFKEVVARKGVDIHGLEAYDSNPVLVIFDITTPDDVSHFWGKQIAHTEYTALQSEQDLYCGWFTFGGMIFALVCSAVLLKESSK